MQSVGEMVVNVVSRHPAEGHTEKMRLTKWMVVYGLLGLLVLAPPAFGWGKEGHRLIAHLAMQHLNGKAKAGVAQLLAQGETLDSIASWADEVRNRRPETSTWHYINIPVGAARGDWKAFCPQTGCVVGVIPDLISKVKDTALTTEQRAEALKFLVHFVGDMHQPLHVGDKGDRGGNDVRVVFLNRPTNLHSLWDTPILETAEQRDPLLKAKLEKKAGFFDRRRLSKGKLDDWVWQGHAASRDTAYGLLPEARPAVLGDDYFAKASPVVQVQIRRGGVRLAQILNDTLGR